MWFGVDYHPEHWVHPYDGTPEEPESRWHRDVELMLRAGVNVVRMGEFCWGLYEPEEGQYDFAWMRRVMDLMNAAGIRVILGTPTAGQQVVSSGQIKLKNGTPVVVDNRVQPANNPNPTPQEK